MSTQYTYTLKNVLSSNKVKRCVMLLGDISGYYEPSVFNKKKKKKTGICLGFDQF